MNADLRIAEYLREQAIIISPVFVRALSGEWPHDLFHVTLQSPSHMFSTEFKTGTAFRLGVKENRLTVRERAAIKTVKALYPSRKTVTAPVSVAGWLKHHAILPAQASILHSVLVDAAAADQSFDDWCGDYGYNDDSLADQRTYQLCRDLLRDLRALLTTEQRSHVQTLLEDY